MTYTFAIVPTKCDRLAGKSPEITAQIEENVRPLMARLDAESDSTAADFTLRFLYR
ncbi:hypothetical protein [Acaryochloris marina]|uniref:hypothetical protein n=1 Tax=Acaryochloris marina TaxID=155978 RepID=UPI0021C31B93|nr:hypothetical protein [Acaryochloris marina]